MELREAQTICNNIRDKFSHNINGTKWNDVFNSEDEIVDALKKVYIPKDRVAPCGTFTGYEYIYSFAFYVKKGWKLSEKQMRQCKRLAVEILKASMIGEYRF